MGMGISNGYSNYATEYSSDVKTANKSNESKKTEQTFSQENTEGTKNTSGTKSTSDTQTTSNAAAAGISYLQGLEKKYSGTAFFVGTVSYGQTYGNSTDTNFVVNPAYLKKLGNNPEEQQKFEESVDFLHNASLNFRKQMEANGRRVINMGWFCDENGNWGGWCVTGPSDTRHYGQEMNDYAKKIREEKAAKKKEQEKLDEKRKAAKEKTQELFDKKSETARIVEQEKPDEKQETAKASEQELFENELTEHFGDDFKGYTVFSSDKVKNPDRPDGVESVAVDIKA